MNKNFEFEKKELELMVGCVNNAIDMGFIDYEKYEDMYEDDAGELTREDLHRLEALLSEEDIDELNIDDIMLLMAVVDYAKDFGYIHFEAYDEVTDDMDELEELTAKDIENLEPKLERLYYISR